ncbi:MAG: hypothetical protein JXQ82_06685 [Methanomicrobiaceae archaeon]|nr:hypothetical protein [Methanomicrobiaceae archaeon]
MRDKLDSLKKKTDLSGNFNKFPKISIILISVSIILLLIALLTDRNDFTTAMLIAVSLINFLTGIIIITFSGSEGVSPDISSMLYPTLITDKAALFAELNVYGDACIIPRALTDSDEILQFNPVGEYNGFNYKKSFFSVDEEKTAGIFSKPSSSALIKYLQDNYGLNIPSVKDSPGSVAEILKEIFTGITPFCENIEVGDNNEDIIVNIKNPVFKSGCDEIRKVSPKCCTASPCPFCSLICSVIAEYYAKPIAVSAVRTDAKNNDLMLILKVIKDQSIEQKSENPK